MNKYTEEELLYLKVILLYWGDIEKMVGKEHSKEWADLINKISEDLKKFQNDV